MGNLGLYQTVVAVMKRVPGGPKVAIPAFFTAGYVVIRSGEAALKKVVRMSRDGFKRRNMPRDDEGQAFTVTSDADAGGGLVLRTGESYRVLERDGDSALIEISDRDDNPFVVSADLLCAVSDYLPTHRMDASARSSAPCTHRTPGTS